MIFDLEAMEKVKNMMGHQGFKVFLDFLASEEDKTVEDMLKCRKEESMRDKVQYIKGIRRIVQFFNMCKTQVAEHTETV